MRSHPAPSQPATPVSAQYEPSLAPETPSQAPPATPSMLGVGKGYGTGSNMRDREPDEGHYYSPYCTASLPPPVLSQSAIEGRLRRIFKPRKDGTFLVDQSWVKQFNEKDNRDQLYSMFENRLATIRTGVQNLNLNCFVTTCVCLEPWFLS